MITASTSDGTIVTLGVHTDSIAFSIACSIFVRSKVTIAPLRFLTLYMAIERMKVNKNTQYNV